MEFDIGAKIMQERLEWAIEIVKKLCVVNKVAFSENLMIKAIEVGISLYIQKERSYVPKSYGSKNINTQ